MERPNFYSMSIDELEEYIRTNNNGYFDLGEVFCSLDEDGEKAEQAYRDELENVAEDIFFNNNPD